MRSIRFLSSCLALAALGAAHADAPDVMTIVQRMQAALEPQLSSTRKLTLTVSGDSPGDTARFTAVQARKAIQGRARVLTVVLAPADQRGVASLIIQGGENQPEVRALWVPALRRTRMLTPVEGYEAYLNSDFTYADLGFVDTRSIYTLLGITSQNGKKVYEVQAVPKDAWYYSRVVSKVDVDSLLPVERDYYDPAGALWKVETFEDITVIDGKPIATHIMMKDIQSKKSSALIVDALKFNVDLPDALFEPGNLKSAGDSPVWPSVL